VNARLSSPNEQKGQHWRLSDFDAAEIDERSALHLFWFSVKMSRRPAEKERDSALRAGIFKA